MNNFYLRFFFKRKKCLHEKVTPDKTNRFCPDCGKEILLYWQIVRCGNCHTKRNAISVLDLISPVEKYCSKCGTKEYFIEEKEKINFYDLNYAVLIKEEIKDKMSYRKTITQIWIDKESEMDNFVQPKLIPLISQ